MSRGEKCQGPGNQESSWRRGCGLGLRCGLREGEDYLSAHARVQSERAFLRQRRRDVPAVPGEGTHMPTLEGQSAVRHEQDATAPRRCRSQAGRFCQGPSRHLAERGSPRRWFRGGIVAAWHFCPSAGMVRAVVLVGRSVNESALWRSRLKLASSRLAADNRSVSLATRSGDSRGHSRENGDQHSGLLLVRDLRAHGPDIRDSRTRSGTDLHDAI